MPDATGKRPRPKRRPANRAQILQHVRTPLGVYVLTLLILEGTLSIVLDGSKLSEEHIWTGFLLMIGVFSGVVALVTLFVWRKPESLVFEKEQYLPPELEPSALLDAVEDRIAATVKSGCLKNPPK